MGMALVHDDPEIQCRKTAYLAQLTLLSTWRMFLLEEFDLASE
jgi:hypothetical protein